MNNLILMLLMLFFPLVKTEEVNLGETPISFTTSTYGKEKQEISFINLHRNESISVDQSKNVLFSIQKFSVVEIGHSGTRNVNFKYKNKTYEIDPNRIFSKGGIKKTLLEYNGKIENTLLLELVDLVDKFAQNYISKYINGKKVIIALHNNTPNKTKSDGYSIYSYEKGGSEYEKGNTDKTIADNPHINSKQDMDDFFVTNRKEYFDAFVTKGYNVVLQSKNPEEDGSLSVYAEKNNISYINIEAEQVLNKNEGHKEAQKQMILAVTKLIE